MCRRLPYASGARRGASPERYAFIWRRVRWALQESSSEAPPSVWLPPPFLPPAGGAGEDGAGEESSPSFLPPAGGPGEDGAGGKSSTGDAVGMGPAGGGSRSPSGSIQNPSSSCSGAGLEPSAGRNSMVLTIPTAAPTAAPATGAVRPPGGRAPSAAAASSKMLAGRELPRPFMMRLGAPGPLRTSTTGFNQMAADRRQRGKGGRGGSQALRPRGNKTV